MPSKVHIGTGEILEGQDATIMHRLYLPSGVAVHTSNTTGTNVTCTVYDLNHPTRPDVAVATINLTRTAVLNASGDPLTTDAYWDKDGTGYSFRATIPYGTDPTNSVNYKGGHRYRHEFTVASTSPDLGEVKWVSVIDVVDLGSV